jgi:hypothetical protein
VLCLWLLRRGFAPVEMRCRVPSELPCAVADANLIHVQPKAVVSKPQSPRGEQKSEAAMVEEATARAVSMLQAAGLGTGDKPLMPCSHCEIKESKVQVRSPL